MKIKSELEFQLYPKNTNLDSNLQRVIQIFENNFYMFDSTKFQYESNKVLSFIAEDLDGLGYLVERSKAREDKISVPVLFGRNGKKEKWFDADAYNRKEKTVIEVEAGRAFTNYQFLKDLFEACVMNDVDFCVIAVRRIYRNSYDFEKIIQFMDTLYSSNKLQLPLKGVLIIGY